MEAGFNYLATVGMRGGGAQDVFGVLLGSRFLGSPAERPVTPLFFQVVWFTSVPMLFAGVVREGCPRVGWGRYSGAWSWVVEFVFMGQLPVDGGDGDAAWRSFTCLQASMDSSRVCISYLKISDESSLKKLGHNLRVHYGGNLREAKA